MGRGKPRAETVFYLMVAALVVMAVPALAWRARTDDGLALALGLTLALTGGAAYFMQRLDQKRAKQAELVVEPGVEMRRAAEPAVARAAAPRAAEAVAFRIVGSRGVCEFGRRVGEVVTAAPGGRFSLALCPFGQATLQLALAHDGGGGVREWSCPVHDHLLVFRREPEAAGAARVSG